MIGLRIRRGGPCGRRRPSPQKTLSAQRHDCDAQMQSEWRRRPQWGCHCAAERIRPNSVRFVL